MDRQYIDTVRLLLAVAPVIFESPYFALKGGTALNLVVQDLPRLSVDIDVVFTDHVMEREQVLTTISDELLIAKARLEHMGYSASLRKTQKGDEAKLLVANQASHGLQRSRVDQLEQTGAGEVGADDFRQILLRRRLAAEGHNGDRNLLRTLNANLDRQFGARSAAADRRAH